MAALESKESGGASKKGEYSSVSTLTIPWADEEREEKHYRGRRVGGSGLVLHLGVFSLKMF